MSFEQEAIINKLQSDQEFSKLVEEYQISNDEVYENLILLYSYYTKKQRCANCPGKENCLQDFKCLTPALSYDAKFNVDYVPCPMVQKEQEKLAKENNLVTIGCTLDNVNSKDFFKNSYRQPVVDQYAQVFKKYCAGNVTKGICLYGIYGNGKTYINGIMAKKFADKGYQVAFAFYPELVRIIKAGIQNGKINEYINFIKQVDVLFFDDFGGESSSAFIRDEVLFPILQYRMDNHLLTFMTTNILPEQLESHLADASGITDNLKAERLFERIRTLMDFVELKDTDNYRLK